jgi:hypothetical protein
MSDDSIQVVEDAADSLSEVELQLLFSLGRLGHESLPAIPQAQDAELACQLTRRGLLSRSEGSDPRVRRYGGYTLTARGFDAYNLRACRRARGSSRLSGSGQEGSIPASPAGSR